MVGLLCRKLSPSPHFAALQRLWLCNLNVDCAVEACKTKREFPKNRGPKGLLADVLM